MAKPTDTKVLVSGGGIAGLTLGILLKERGYDPLVIEREPEIRTEGYMMDFFGTGWDVAERMGLVEALRAIRYPIDALEFVDANGKVRYTVPIGRVGDALDHRYVYLRRPDLLRILRDRARERQVDVRFGCSITALREEQTHVFATLDDGGSGTFALVFGADGIHSKVRSLVFGPEQEFTRFLGGYVAAFHLPRHSFEIGRALKLYEETDLVAGLYPLDEERMDATYVIRHGAVDLDRGKQLAFMREQVRGAGWIAEDIIDAYESDAPIYFDGLTQIVMNDWHKGRIALLGDACGSLTLLAGQGSHMAMGGAYVIARELERHDGDHEAAFAAYQRFFKPHVSAKQDEAARFERIFVPSASSRPWLRRLAIRVFFSRYLLPVMFRSMGARSVLAHYG